MDKVEAEEEKSPVQIKNNNPKTSCYAKQKRSKESADGQGKQEKR